MNDEFGALTELLRTLPTCLRPGGRVAILSFHSGEDRRVKSAFKEGLRAGRYVSIAEEVIRPSAEEKRENPRSSSAKLRFAVRIMAEAGRRGPCRGGPPGSQGGGRHEERDPRDEQRGLADSERVRDPGDLDDGHQHQVAERGEAHHAISSEPAIDFADQEENQGHSREVQGASDHRRLVVAVAEGARQQPKPSTMTCHRPIIPSPDPKRQADPSDRAIDEAGWCGHRRWGSSGLRRGHGCSVYPSDHTISIDYRDWRSVHDLDYSHVR